MIKHCSLVGGCGLQSLRAQNEKRYSCDPWRVKRPLNAKFSTLAPQHGGFPVPRVKLIAFSDSSAPRKPGNVADIGIFEIRDGKI